MIECFACDHLFDGDEFTRCPECGFPPPPVHHDGSA